MYEDRKGLMKYWAAVRKILPTLSLNKVRFPTRRD